MEDLHIRPVTACLTTALKVAVALMLATTAAAETRPVVAGRFQPEWTAGAAGKFGVGAERRTVVQMMGLPEHQIGDSLWIYYQCGTVSDDPRTKGLDALVILFQQNRVAALRLTDSTVLRNLIAQQKLKVTGPSYADLLR
jgi:hypothetical protein